MLKIRWNPLYYQHRDPGTFFDLNAQDYTIQPSLSISDSIITISNGVNDTIGVELNIFHNFENQFDLAKFNPDPTRFHIISATTNINNSNVIFNDFIFNRTKAYYNQFPFSPHTKKWYHTGQLSYIIPTHTNAESKHKIYVSPNKTYNGTRFYRTKIVELLKQHQQDLGYLGNMDNNSDLWLYPHGKFPHIDKLTALESIPDGDHRLKFGGYYPPHNEYYKNTFISIYGETIEYGTTICVSEKTYDPMIKGHFVLPFSTYGFIKHLKNNGFKFPDFINYSYDDIQDDPSRFYAYSEEVKRLLSLDLDTWRAHWKNNYSIVRHNQLQFHERPYDRIDFYKLLAMT